MRTTTTAPSADANESYRAVVADAERYIDEVLTLTHTPGLNLAVAHGDVTVWAAGYGLADVQRGRPMRPETVLRAASMSKLYTAVAVMQLVEQGVLELYGPASRWVADVGLSNPLGEREVTIYDLLTFRSGLAVDTTDAQIAEPLPLEAHLRSRLASGRLREYGNGMPIWGDKVGASHQYSNLGIAVLGLIVERANRQGLSFTQYIERFILAPLGMRSSAFPPAHLPALVPAHIWHKISTGYAGFGDILVRSPWLHGACFPSNGLLTIPEDHLRLLLALRNGSLHGIRLLQDATVKWMRTPQVALGHALMPSDWHAGLGLVIADPGSPLEHYGHGGSQMWGWWNEARVYPHLDLAVVVATNRWDMVHWHNPAKQSAAALVIDYIARRFASADQVPCAASDTALPWKVSYVVGALLVERTDAFLGAAGAQEPVRPTIDATTVAAVEASSLWDADGFVAGARDMAASGTRPRDIREFFGSTRCKVRVEDLPLCMLALGSDGPPPAPLAFWQHVDFGAL